MSSRPGDARSEDGSGSAMHDGAPPEARSKDRSSGPSSSQVASSRGRGGGAGAEKSGSRKGLASWREITERGTTCFSGRAAAAAGAASGLGLGRDLQPAGGAQLAQQRPGVGQHLGVLGEQREQRAVAGGGAGEGGRDAVEALELLGAAALGQVLGLQPGALLAHQQRHGLERAAGRRPGAAPLDGELDVAHGLGEHGDDALLGAALRPR